jgi:hypothetical protein
MLLSELWKNSAKDVIKMVWGDKISEKNINSYLDKIIQSRKQNFPILEMKNIYTNQGLHIPLDDILDIVDREDLCIEGNNTLTYSYRRVKSPIPKILIELKSERDKHKWEANDLSEAMTKMRKEGVSVDDPRYIETEIRWSTEDSLEKAIKILMNSIYGVQGQNGSIIYSPDTAGGVTSQGRALISEMMWSIERFLYGAIHFSTFSEFFNLLNSIIHEVDYKTPLLEYISYRPTKSDIKKKIISLLYNVPEIYQKIDTINISIYHFINNLDDVQRIYLYYKCDFMKLVLQNKNIANLIYTLLNDPSPFNSTSPKDIPESFTPILDLLSRLIGKFVIVKTPTPKRIDKYTSRRRRGIILSDTDSVVINLQPYVKKMSELYYKQNNLDASLCEHLAFNNENMCFKIVNIMSYLCTYVTKEASDIFCKSSNVPEELRNWITMKNEYYFMRMIMYVNAKKNYICYVRLKEGKIQDDVSATGKLNNSTVNTFVHDKIMETIENKILKCQFINPADILRDIKQLERDIITRIINGDITFGRKGRYSGPNGYKTVVRKKKGDGAAESKKNSQDPGDSKTVPGLYTNNIGRSCYIWNLLYPASKINIGDYAYIFNTNIETIDDLDKLKYEYPVEYENIKSLIFENDKEPFLSKYGLRSIAIPITERVTSIPKWIVKYIDYEEITNKHLQPIISLIPSVGTYTSRMAGTKNTYSPLISF